MTTKHLTFSCYKHFTTTIILLYVINMDYLQSSNS